MSDIEAMVATTPARKQQKPIWKKLRRRRRENLPTQMLMTGGLLACLAVLGHNEIFPEKPEPAAEAYALGGGRQLSTLDAAAAKAANFLDYSTKTLNYSQPASCPVTVEANSTFPAIFPDAANQKGVATFFYLLITFFMFLGLAIVCDEFFETSLSAICEAQNLKDDVAGATWMAAGGSAPELMTSFIGLFISYSDVGFGTIVGSAVFNVLFVIACCAFVAPNLKLTWWPLARDASYYCFSLAMIVFFVSDDLQIAVWEAITLLIMYAGYVTVMYFNENLEAWVTERVRLNETKRSGAQTALIALFDNPIFAACLYAIILTNAVIVILEIDEFNQRAAELPCLCEVYVGAVNLPNTAYFYINLGFNIFFILEMLIKFFAYGFFGYWKVPLNCFDGALVFLIVVELVLTNSTSVQDDLFADSNDAIGVGVARMFRLLKFVRMLRVLRVFKVLRIFTKSGDNQVSPEGDFNKSRTDESNGEKPAKEAEAAEEEEEDDDDDEPFNPLDIPDSMVGRFFWLVGLPLRFAFFFTIPDCRREIFKKYWLGTFTMCIVWIAVLAAVMVWMVERFGILYNIPPSIMGLTLLAAGTSIPDCLSSVAVAKRGHGDMAVSSSIGSNIFDVLLGLPLPWFIYTAILRPAGVITGPQWVIINSEALAVMILSLFVMVALVVTTIHLSGWILSVRLGIMMMVLYFLFLVLALLLEYGVVFGPCKPNLSQFTFQP